MESSIANLVHAKVGALSLERRALLALRLRSKPASASQLQPTLKEERPEHLPLSFAQQRMWFLDQLEQGDPSSNIAIATRITDHIEVAVLERALTEVVRRHEVLR